jgi:DNA-binding transcriptional LysR family regulator
MQLEELSALILVAEAGSFATAAEREGVARTTLRRRVDALEARVNVPLLVRGRRGVELTTAGQTVVRQARQLMHNAAYLLDQVRSGRGEPVGTLRWVVPTGFPPHGMVPFLSGLRSRYPRVNLMISVQDDPTRALRDGVDLVVHFGEAPLGPWESIRLATLRVWLIASREYVDQHGMPEELDALPEHDLMVWRAPDRDPRLLPLRDGRIVEIEPAIVTADIHLLRQAALAGNGIALVPDAMLPDPGHPPEIVVPVLRTLVGEKRSVYLTVPDALASVPAVAALVTAVRAAMVGDA